MIVGECNQWPVPWQFPAVLCTSTGPPQTGCQNYLAPDLCWAWCTWWSVEHRPKQSAEDSSGSSGSRSTLSAVTWSVSIACSSTLSNLNYSRSEPIDRCMIKTWKIYSGQLYFQSLSSSWSSSGVNSFDSCQWNFQNCKQLPLHSVGLWSFLNHRWVWNNIKSINNKTMLDLLLS